jgi:activator of HSP90 ATPase
MQTRTIKQSITFKATPHQIYTALMDSRKHSKFTGSKAIIGKKKGDRFSTYDGYMEGVMLEMIPDEKIVQSWRGSDWPDGHYSEATFLLKRVDGGALLELTQTGVPDRLYEEISQGWHDFYWKPMREMLEE